MNGEITAGKYYEQELLKPSLILILIIRFWNH